MGFMEPETQWMSAWHVETSHGTEIVPSDLVGDWPTSASLAEYIEGRIEDESPYGDAKPWHRERGYYARLSAPGYLDCTDWLGPYPTADEARRELAYHHDVCPHCWDACWDDTSIRIGDGRVSVEDTAQASRDGRPVYRWTIDTPDGMWSAADLRGPVCSGRAEPCMRSVLATLLAFLASAIESRDEELFPAAAITWAQTYADDIAIEQSALEDEDG